MNRISLYFVLSYPVIHVNVLARVGDSITNAPVNTS